MVLLFERIQIGCDLRWAPAVNGGNGVPSSDTSSKHLTRGLAIQVRAIFSINIYFVSAESGLRVFGKKGE